MPKKTDSGILRLLPEVNDEMRAALEKMRRDMPILVEYMQIIAEMKMAKYKALVAQGFTSDQALELCKHD